MIVKQKLLDMWKSRKMWLSHEEGKKSVSRNRSRGHQILELADNFKNNFDKYKQIVKETDITQFIRK